MAAHAERLSREYSQWKFNSGLLAKIRLETEAYLQNEHMSQSVRQQIQFGRWLMAVQHYNAEQLDERYPLFPRQPLEGAETRTELVQRLTSICEIGQDEAERQADGLLTSIEEFLGNETEGIEEASKLRFDEDDASGRIEMGHFRTPHCQRVKYLVRRFGVESTALVCLRYHHLSLFRGGESSMSVTALNAIHDVGRATFEGFASPINCRLLGRPGVQFCSLFPDTDAAFGSLGNFFRINLADYPGGWILNPPFVEPVLEATARRVEQILSHAEAKSHWFYVTLPDWPDSQSEAWKILDRSEWKVARVDFEQSSFIQQDCYGKCYWPRAGLCVFVLGHPPEDVDLIELRNRICGTDESAVDGDWLVACRAL